MENVENSVFNGDRGNEEPLETNGPVFVNKLSGNRLKILMVELSAVTGGKNRIYQSSNVCKRQVEESDDKVMSKGVSINGLQEREKRYEMRLNI